MPSYSESSKRLQLPGRIQYLGPAVYRSTWHDFLSILAHPTRVATNLTAFNLLTTWPIRIAVVICQYHVTSAASALLWLTHSSAEVTPRTPSTVVTLPSLWVGPARCHDDRGLQPPWGHTGHEGQLVRVTVQSVGP